MAQGNYVAFGDRSGPFPLVLPSQVQTSGVNYSGHGSPEGIVPGMPGQTYTDLDTHNQWLKMAGTGESGWRLIGATQ